MAATGCAPAEQFARWLEETRAFSGKVTEAEAFALACRITPGAVDHHMTFEPAPAPNGAVPTNVALEGDCLQVLCGLPDDCIDAEPYPIDHTCAPSPTRRPCRRDERTLSTNSLAERYQSGLLRRS